MTKTDFANAFPRKHFFLEMFTRDISIEDCILDLIDNSIDALFRTRNLDVRELIFNSGAEVEESEKPIIKFTYNENEIIIEDKCGGIPTEHVAENVFSFGHTDDYKHSRLGVYGVGLKRALFKLGNIFEIHSKTTDGGFKTQVDINEWAKKDTGPDDWRIGVTYTKGANKLTDAGTIIKIKQLRDEVQQRLNDPMMQDRILKASQRAYCIFLNRVVHLYINGRKVEPVNVPLGESEEARIGIDKFEDQEVNVTIYTGLALRDKDGKWAAERAGWYIFCNGRLVVTADKTQLTGWGAELPGWHTKYIGFIGIVIFESKNPARLPWTTTKRGLNWESPVYLLAKDRMILLCKPVINFLNKMYASEPVEKPLEREATKNIKEVELAKMSERKESIFKFEKRISNIKTTTRIQYDAENKDIERIKKKLGKKSISCTEIGKITFDYYLKKECPR